MSPGIILAVAIAAEVTGTLALRASDGLTRLGPSLLVLAGYGISFWLMSRLLLRIPVSVTYAIWSATGTAIIAAIGMVFLGEPATAVRLVSLALIVVGVVGLNLAGGGHA